MLEKVELYKTTTFQILEMIGKDEIHRVNELFNKRQAILDEVGKNEEFKKRLLNEGLLEIDKQIHEILNDKINNTKNEIKENRLSQRANNSYINSSIKKLNIFNKKV